MPDHIWSPHNIQRLILLNYINIIFSNFSIKYENSHRWNVLNYTLRNRFVVLSRTKTLGKINIIYLIDHKILNDWTIINYKRIHQHSEPRDAENRTRYLVTIITRNCSIYRADPLTVTTVLVILINVITPTLGAADAVVL